VGRKPLDELSKEGKKLLRELILHQDHPLPAKIYPIKKPMIKASTTFDMSEEFKRMDDAIASFADELNILEEEEERPKSQVDVSQEEAEYDYEMDALMKEIFGEEAEAIVEEKKETTAEIISRINEADRIRKEQREIKKAEDAKNYQEWQYQRYLKVKGTPQESDWISPYNVAREKAEAEAKLSGKGLLLGGALSINHIKKMLKASYKDAPERIDDFILDKQLSGQYGVVYFNPRTGQAVVVHRGTKEAMDWTNNAMYALGMYKYTNRYKTGLQMQRKAEKKYGAKNITTLGHSQGAILARELGQNTKEILTLNPAYKGEKPLKNEYNIRSSGDLVSVGLHGTRRGHDLLIGSRGFNPLDEHMIDILDRVDQNKMFGAN
jgi:hypothetical protein